MKTPIKFVTFRGSDGRSSGGGFRTSDLMAAGVVRELDVAVGEPSIEVELAPTE